MDSYKTDDEQLDSIKSWFRENVAGIAVVLLVVVGFFGGRALWQNFNSSDYEETYIQFEQVSQLRDAALSDSGNDQAFSEYVKSIDALKESSPDHALTDLAVLKIAADYAAREEWDQAESQLRWLEEQQVVPALQSLVSLRLAQVLLQKDQPDDAISTIKRAIASDDDYLPRLKELEGDIYLDQEAQSKALAAYKDAAKAYSEKGVTSPTLQWKIDDLAAAQ